MSAYKFKGWENIDGSSVTREETDSAFKVVMHSAREIEAAYQVRQKTVKRAKVMRIMMYAAAALILIASPLAIYHMMDHEETDLMATSSLTTDHGEIQEITLPDGSMVTLNSGSTLTWPDEFSKNRVVTLTGEALFNVTADRKHKFIVRTEELQITVHGTIFDVCDYPEDGRATVTLCKGSVAVKRSEERVQAATLSPDQTYTYDKESGAVTVKVIDAAEATLWTGGHIYIKSQTLEQAARMVERRFGVNIHFLTDKHQETVLTAKFANGETLHEIMAAIRQLVPEMEYSIEEKDILIR